jgi:hypothetical protein
LRVRHLAERAEGDGVDLWNCGDERGRRRKCA